MTTAAAGGASIGGASIGGACGCTGAWIGGACGCIGGAFGCFFETCCFFETGSGCFFCKGFGCGGGFEGIIFGFFPVNCPGFCWFSITFKVGFDCLDERRISSF